MRVAGRFDFTLKFLQYPRWGSGKLDYSGGGGVGLHVGYWNGGYCRWAIHHPRNLGGHRGHSSLGLLRTWTHRIRQFFKMFFHLSL